MLRRAPIAVGGKTENKPPTGTKLRDATHYYVSLAAGEAGDGVPTQVPQFGLPTCALHCSFSKYIYELQYIHRVRIYIGYRALSVSISIYIYIYI